MVKTGTLCLGFGSASSRQVRALRRNDYTYSFLKCCECRLVYVGNPLETVVEKNEPSASTLGPVLVHPRHRQTFRLLQKAQTAEGQEPHRVLEVGAGLGSLGNLLSQDRGIDYLGFEPNQFRAEFCQNQGLNVITGFYDESRTSGFFDAIILDNVLEHVLRPASLIADLIKKLAPRADLL